MKYLQRFLAVWLLTVNFHGALAAENISWTNYESAPVGDGRLRIRAFWQRSSPAHEILNENGLVRASQIEGATYEFCVLLENVGKLEIELPSSPRGGLPIVGIPLQGKVVVPYIIRFGEAFGALAYVESEVTFRPVRLKPGEATRLPVYYRIVKTGESLPVHWFFYAVEESVAKRFGWWSGALACKSEEFLPAKDINRTSQP